MVLNTSSPAEPGVSQIAKDRSVALLKLLCFKARPKTFGLSVVEAFIAAALRTQATVLVELVAHNTAPAARALRA
ncbi:hypothetical protein BXP70_26840 [Hymenobacter crusticola]|uniref:Uncharacterized protein n=1 Tax=Hymenobacter crusticola TaxID=1770526 RepID=A0A243W5V4_9BACT|nr:hypothetical protein BXP70_26840 [Hymenobacter crusticola]